MNGIIPLFAAMFLQASFTDMITETIGDVIAYIPTIVGVLLILVVGYIIGRVLGGIVTRVVQRIGLDKFAKGTALSSSGEDGLARALGKLVAYYVYFVTVVAAASVLEIDALSSLLADLGSFLPVILGAIVVLVIGFIVGRFVGSAVADLVGSFGIGPYLRGTPFERFGDTEGEFGRLVGTVVTYYIYLLTLVAVADIIEIGPLSELLNTFAGYFPALVAGLLVLLVGIWLAERVAALISGTDESRAMDLAGLAVKILIYYITITIALGTIGFEIDPLTSLFTTFMVAFLGALALALAIGIGVAVGLGGKDYVAENIDGWMGQARSVAELDENESGDSTE